MKKLSMHAVWISILLFVSMACNHTELSTAQGPTIASSEPIKLEPTALTDDLTELMESYLAIKDYPTLI